MSEEPPVHAASPAVAPRIIETRVKGVGWKWFWIAFIVCFLGGCATLLLLLGQMGQGLRSFLEESMETSSVSRIDYDASGGLSEVVLRRDKKDDTGNKILLIEVSGVIIDMGSSRYGSRVSVSPGVIEKQLEKAGKDPKVRAVILRVDSPGGEAFACDLIAAQVQRFQRLYEKPVVAWINSMGASGGYYVSAPCQWVIAHEMSVVGSIGVIASSYNYRELLDKVGVKPMVYKSGRLKDMLSPSRKEEDITSEEKAMMQNLIDKMFARFKNVVKEGRTQESRQELAGARPLAENWEEYADGRILLGGEAYEVGMVDELGGEEEAIAAAKRLAKIEGSRLIQYELPMDWRGLLRFFSETHSRKVEVSLNGLGLNSAARIEPGKVYFLPPAQ
ncbi:MAG TPA: signal peptide peptidase SppA [Verrucomicrobiota bacterium]|nr:signal peptide peptidase SppA [Verrucomicrobiota bacterium]